MAIRDQIISEQRDVISNLWRILQATGISKQQIMDLARQEGILMQVCMAAGTYTIMSIWTVCGRLNYHVDRVHKLLQGPL